MRGSSSLRTVLGPRRKAADAKRNTVKQRHLVAPARLFAKTVVVSNEKYRCYDFDFTWSSYVAVDFIGFGKDLSTNVAVLYFDYAGKDENLAVLKGFGSDADYRP